MSRLAKAITIGQLTGIVGVMLGFTPFGLDLEEQVGLHILFMLRGERPVPAEIIIVSIDRASATHLDLPAVFVGFSEHLRPALKDGFHAVFSQANGIDISGVEIAATAFANLLEAMPLQPPSLPWHAAILLLGGMAVGMLCHFLPTITTAVSTLGLSTLYLFTVQYQFATIGMWYPLIIPVFLQMPLAFFSATLWKYFDTSNERRNIRQALHYYLPPAVVPAFWFQPRCSMNLRDF